MSLDLALAPNEDGTALVLHRADCPVVRKQAADGVPVLTMYDCARPPKDDVIKHSCMDVH
jgi:hypothetical protein